MEKADGVLLMSSERKEFEQTISAKSPVRWAKVATSGAHFVQDDGHAQLRSRPGGLGPGHAAADDVKAFS